MGHSPHKSHEESKALALSEPQETALASLREGSSFMAAAREAGIGRATLYRWLQTHPQFRAAYNLWQREVAESARARLLKLTDKAVEVVERALERNDEKVALKMLRGTGVLRRRRVGSIDSEVLDLQMQLAKRRQTKKAAAGMLHELLGKAGYSPRQRQRIIDGQDTTELRKALDNQIARATQNVASETLCETDAGVAGIDPTQAVADSTRDAAANNLPPQEIRENSQPSGLHLVDETLEVEPAGVSHDSREDEQAQVLQGWRIGERLYGTQ